MMKMYCGCLFIVYVNSSHTPDRETAKCPFLRCNRPAARTMETKGCIWISWKEGRDTGRERGREGLRERGKGGELVMLRNRLK
jgi:hypothetical protein